ncbi:MAG: hypothetical protein JXA21_17720 [Anaerolineae bacterium]|nr:hypothetical protein [Anaerolineae bacterium]
MTSKKRSPRPDVSPPYPAPDKLGKALDAAFPDGRGLRALHLAQRTGVVNTLQLQNALDLSRDQVNRLLVRFEELAPGALLTRVPVSVPRPGQRGQPPAAYTLGPGGAALLRAHDVPDAQSCQLRDPTALAHALAVLDMALVAETAGLPVQIETTVPYGDGHVLRPDLLITLSTGARLLYELEQHADIALLRRICDSLRHKRAFFSSSEAALVSTTVRMVVNLPRGTAWDTTLAVWERALEIVLHEHGGPLPFRLLAMPLTEFLERPDWDERPVLERWELIGEPVPGPTPPARTAITLARPQALPAPLVRRTVAEDHLILLAYWQYMLDHAAELGITDATPQADPAFFTVMQVIYAASHDFAATPWQVAQHPRASLYLLHKYLDMHPHLRALLSKALTRGSGSLRWSLPTILHRMQTVIDGFLRYHGLRNCSTLDARPMAPQLAEDGNHQFGVWVTLNPEILLGDASGVVPDQAATAQAEAALAWVLYALFAYGADLGLKRAGFW